MSAKKQPTTWAAAITQAAQEFERLVRPLPRQRAVMLAFLEGAYLVGSATQELLDKSAAKARRKRRA